MSQLSRRLFAKACCQLWILTSYLVNKEALGILKINIRDEGTQHKCRISEKLKCLENQISILT